METLMKRSFFVLMALLGMTTLRAQTADDIVNKYLDAIGGKTAIGSIKSLLIESNLSVQGNDAPSTTTILVGTGYKSETDFNGTKIVNCVNATGGWILNPMMGAATATAMTTDQYKASKMELQIDPLANYAASGFKIELIGKDTADYKVKMSGNGVDVTYYINMKSYLIDKAVSKAAVGGQDGETTISFSDYRKLDAGILFPYAETLDLPQISLAITHKKVTVNPTVDPMIFNMPK